MATAKISAELSWGTFWTFEHGTMISAKWWIISDLWIHNTHIQPALTCKTGMHFINIVWFEGFLTRWKCTVWTMMKPAGSIYNTRRTTTHISLHRYINWIVRNVKRTVVLGWRIIANLTRFYGISVVRFGCVEFCLVILLCMVCCARYKKVKWYIRLSHLYCFVRQLELSSCIL